MENKKYKTTGMLFLLAAAAYVVYAIGYCIQQAVTVAQFHLELDLARSILIYVRNSLIIGGSFSLLALYCMKYQKEGKGKLLYFIGLGIYALWQGYSWYVQIEANTLPNLLRWANLYSVLNMLTIVLTLVVLALMLVVKFKRSRILTVAGMAAFGGWAALLIWSGIINYLRSIGAFSQSLTSYVLGFLLFVFFEVFAIMQFAAFFKLWWTEDGNRIFKKKSAEEKEEAPAPLNSAQKSCRTCFAVVFALTILLWCVLTAFVIFDLVWGPPSQDDIFGDSLVLPYWFALSAGPLAVILIVEFVVYLWKKHSLRD